jgi:predicted TIM-barrel fold metal-dependent hydrolase
MRRSRRARGGSSRPTHCHVISPDQARFPRAPIGGKQSDWAVSRPVTARAGTEMAELAQHPGLYLKLTHRNLERLSDAGNEAIRFLEAVLSAFGAERIAWGSNYPAAEQSLPELLELAKRVLGVVPVESQVKIFADTARRLYPALGKAVD